VNSTGDENSSKGAAGDGRVETRSLIEALANKTKPRSFLTAHSGKLLLLILVAALIVVFSFLSVRSNLLNELSTLPFLTESLIFIFLSGASFFTAWRLFTLRVPISTFWLRVPLWGIVLAFIIYALRFLISDPGTFVICSSGVGCLVGVVLSTLLFVGLITGLGFVSKFSRVGAACVYVALGSASLALLTLRFHCDDNSAIHLLMWHFLPVVFAMILGFFVIRKILVVR
jgi:hypothetical protein